MSSAIITRRGGSGGGSIRLITVQSEARLPGSAPEGTAAVISTTPAVRLYATNTPPASPKTGDVWLSVGVASNAPIQAGMITVYPAGFRQYVNGEWQNVTGFVRHGGEWVSMELMLFETGNAYLAVTGGWMGNGNVTTISPGENLTLSVPAEGYINKMIATNLRIPAGRYSKLVAVGQRSYVAAFEIGFSQSQTSTDFDVKTSFAPSGEQMNSPATVELSLADLSPEYDGYLKIRLNSVPGARDPSNATVSKIYLTN